MERFKIVIIVPAYNEEKTIYKVVSSLIKYSEFIAACLEQNVAYSDGVIADAFSKMDLDKSGFISKENLTDLMRSASNDLNDDQVSGELEKEL